MWRGSPNHKSVLHRSEDNDLSDEFLDVIDEIMDKNATRRQLVFTARCALVENGLVEVVCTAMSRDWANSF